MNSAARRIRLIATTLSMTLAALVATATSTHRLRAQSPDSIRALAPEVDPRAVQPERPTVATHAYTVVPGYLEIEAGVQDARPSGASQFIAPIVVKVGLVPRLQLELQGGYVRNAALGAATSGAADVAVALKQRVLDAAPIVHDLSLQGSIKFATGTRDISTRTTDVSLLLISSRPIGVAELDLNAGSPIARVMA